MLQAKPVALQGPSPSTTEDFFEYDDKTPLLFAWATVIWGVVGMLVGLIIAIQLFYWPLNLNLPWLSFGRLRPLHTNAVIFAFCGNAIFAGIYHSSQRLLKTRMYSDLLSRVHFWGWQLIIVSAALTLPLGISSSKEYAELEWPIDIAITGIWVVFAVNYFMTLRQRREPILYVSIWFYIATILAIAMLHIVNSLAIPVGPFKSISIYAGIQDALVQWWYGHNAVAFFLTTPFLGLAYYYIPKAIGLPIYSYRLSIIHFWSLIFVYIWAGPHHLLNSSLPNWLQNLGMVFSVMLIAPSWGGAINFVLTLRMGWHKVKTDPILKFFIAGTSFYMMSTFEGPLLSIKSVNALAHNTDWIVGHVHSGALGWNGFIIFGMLYWLIPSLYRKQLHSKKWAEYHFWIGTLGIALYIISMWVSGVTMGLMTQQIDADGVLAHPNYIEIVRTILPLHVVRALGGLLYLSGVVLMAYNLYLTVKGCSLPASAKVRSGRSLVDPNAIYSSLHEAAERQPSLLIQLSVVALAIGGILEMVPMFLTDHKRGDLAAVPYSPLELEGRDIYIREGCNNCHTQQVRPLAHEVKRYGQHSKADEFANDYPHLWGSKRTGPDLHRVGGKYNDSWHWNHLVDPRSIVAGSIMPSYEWLVASPLDTSRTAAKIAVLKSLGVPYSLETISGAVEELQAQQTKLAAQLEAQGVKGVDAQSEMVALVAYLQKLGKLVPQSHSASEKGAHP
jgi:cytochrome c oxidase cbb3-type subunit I/II